MSRTISDFEKLSAAHLLVNVAQRPFGRFTMFMLKAFALILCILGVVALCGQS